MKDSLPANRLGLARWLVDRDNPLVARVAVNRLWEQLFGRGLVETSEDFGTQGEPPSHPELLDWLAVELMDRGWSQKALLRTIVTSATYRQASAVPRRRSPSAIPYNRLLARGPRFRLEAEMIRDGALAASGLLSAEDARAERLPAAAGGHLEHALQRGSLGRERGRGSLPPQPLHVPAAHLAVSDADDVRRHQPRVLRGAARPHQHAAAGADAAERSRRRSRRRGRWRRGSPAVPDARRAGPRAPSGWSSRAIRSRPSSRGCWPTSTPSGRTSPSAVRRGQAVAPSPAAGQSARRRRGLDARRQRAPEPRRDGHEELESEDRVNFALAATPNSSRPARRSRGGTSSSRPTSASAAWRWPRCSIPASPRPGSATVRRAPAGWPAR